MTPAERAALRELVAKATPGPWAFDTGRHDIYQPLVGDGKQVLLVHNYRDVDVAFITAVREALPKLLDDCDRLEDRLAAIRRTVRHDPLVWSTLIVLFEGWDAEDAQAAKKDGDS